MKVVNIEIKAWCANPEAVRQKLRQAKAEYKGLDHQIDTYFNVLHGRLKLRQGNIEHSLIFYDRLETSDLKESKVIYDKLDGSSALLKSQLTEAIGVKVVVDKKREIYFIDNVKFHIDEVDGLGSFVEIEAIGKKGDEEELTRQCRFYMAFLEVNEEDLIGESYSDMMMANGGKAS